MQKYIILYNIIEFNTISYLCFKYSDDKIAMESSGLKDKTAKGVLWGGLGTFFYQFLSLVFGIFLARLLNAEDYGVVGLLTVFSLLANTFTESGFTKALINRSEIKQEDYNAVFWFNIMMGIILYIILFFCAPWIARFYQEPRLTELSRFVFLSIPISALGVAPSAYMYKKLMVKQRTLATWLALILSSTVGVILAFHHFAYWGLAVQTVLFVGTITLFTYVFSKWKPTLQFSSVPLKEMFPYSVKLIITRIVTVVNTNLFTIFLGKFFSVKTVGNYNQGNKWASFGMGLITGIMTNLTQPVLSTIDQEKERHYAAFRKLVHFTAFLGFPVMLGMAYVAQELIVILITEKWAASASIMSVLCVGYAFYCIGTVFSDLLLQKGRSDLYLYVNILSGVAQLLCLVLLYPYGMKALLLSSVAIQIAVLFVWYLFVYKEIQYKLKHFIGDVMTFAAITTLSILAAHFILLPVKNLYLLFVLKVLIVAVLYTGILYTCKAVILQESFEYLRRYAVGFFRKRI